MLQMAREIRGLTQSDLANRLGISQGKVSKVLDGIQAFPDEHLPTLERVLRFPKSFFFRDWSYDGPPPHLFRKRLTLSKKIVREASAKMSWRRHQITELLKNVDRREVRIPRLDLDDLEGGPAEAARLTRIALRVLPGPIINLVRSIEKAGCIIIPFDFASAKIDACAEWIDDIPVIFANLSVPRSRLRFSLSHELGHLVLHNLPTESSEDEANRFGSEFLMPESEIRSSLVAPNLERLGKLKLHWKVSMAAILHKAQSSGTISEYQARKLWMALSQRGFKTNEPYEELLPKEEPTLLKQLMSVYRNELEYSEEELADKLSVFPEDLADFEGNGAPQLRIVI
jgi:Zn-dependent peptidase ImmA (M78 family)